MLAKKMKYIKFFRLIEKLNLIQYLQIRHSTMGLGEHQIFVSKD